VAGFNLSDVFRTVAAAAPDREAIVHRDRRLTFAEVDARADAVAAYLAGRGLGCRTERAELAGHESGQDHVGLYLRNGSEYVEAMIAGFRARVAPFNVNYRYVAAELTYLLRDAGAKALVYHAEFAPAVAAIRDDLPDLEVLVQVADDSGHPLLPGAVDYESMIASVSSVAGLPRTSGDDLYILYTGGTTGLPKGVLWRNDDIFVTSMGGTPWGGEPYTEYAQIAAAAEAGAMAMSLLMVPPLMHGAAQWGAFHILTAGGKVVFPAVVHHLDPADVLRTAERERVVSIPVVGDATAIPLIEELERGSYDLSGMFAVTNGGAPLTPRTRDRLLEALPHILLRDAAGSSESGPQLESISTRDSRADAAVFTVAPGSAVLDDLRGRVLDGADGVRDGWLARQGRVPLGYLGDPEKTLVTFPVIDGVRWAVPGDRARLREDGTLELLGRDNVTINSGGEKIFAEEVERAMAAHPAVRDVVVVGRPSPRWGQEVVAVVRIEDGAEVSDAELLDACAGHLARYKVPKAVIRRPEIARSPAGKADYRWARAQTGAVPAGPAGTET
jgi:acyl-CoA synthetase (AMP-forming)/AMP-acid ligase II